MTRRAPARRAAAVAASSLAALAAGAFACARPAPIVEARVLEIDPPALRRIAVAPFLPAANFKGSAPVGESTGAEAAEAAALVTRHVTEAFAAQGYDMVPASDLTTLFEAQGQVVPHGEAEIFARAAAAEFGATALLLGEVYRYRERRGGEMGATRAASVGFTLTLITAPAARELWKARFDRTQPALSENVLEARRYPGSGSRWLSAAELTRWGAEVAAERLLELK